MDDAATGGMPSLREFGDALKRQWWMLALGAVVGLAVASVYLLVAPKTYESSALVLVAPIEISDSTVDGVPSTSGINLATEAQLMKSQAVSSRAKEQLETIEPVGQLARRVSVAVIPNTSVIKVTFADNDPEAARAGAQAFADQYLVNRQEAAASSADAQERELRRLIAQLETEAIGQEGIQRESTLLEIGNATARLNTLVGTSFEPGEVISLAVTPQRPASPDRLMVLSIGFGLGLLLGLLGVAILQRRDGRVFNWRFVERRHHLPLLVNVPGVRDEAPALLPPHSVGGQAFTRLRTILMDKMPDGGVIVVADPEEGSGSDMVAANLGASFARADQPTTVLVADAKSSVPAMLGTPHGPGLTELLRRKASISDVRRQVAAVSGLSVIAPGLHLAEVDDLEGAGIADVLATVSGASHLLIVRAPATTAGADAQLLARLADAALPVVTIGSSHRAAIDEMLGQWSVMDVDIPGFVAVAPYGAGAEPILVSPQQTDRNDEAPAPSAALR